MIELKNIAFDYGNGVPIFTDVSMTLGKGEMIALGGKNGCGKTTITRIIMGLEQPTAGSIYYNGQDVTKTEPAERGRYIGYVFQQPDRQMFRSTVWEEIAYGPEQMGCSAAEVQRRVAKALEATNLTEWKEAYPQLLSRGQKQRVAIASAMAMETEYLILDEPTSGQDGEEKYILMNVLKGLNDRGMTIILITHDMEIMAGYCTRAIIMGNKTKAFDGTPETLFTTREDLQELGLNRPACVTLSLAIPGMPYCATMEQFRNEAAKRMRGE